MAESTTTQMLQLRQSRPSSGPMPSPKESQDQLYHRRTRRNDEPTNTPHPRGSTRQRPLLIRPTLEPPEGRVHKEIRRKVAEFSRCLIRSALIRRYRDQDVFLSNRKSMTLRIFIHSKSRRAEAVALLDSGATENFININYVKKLGIPIRRLTHERRLFNVDGTPNKAGALKYYVDMTTKTGEKRTRLRYFLTDLGENQVILGYPWFASAQPKIDWAKGWINYDQLPIVLRSDDADKAIFATRIKGKKVVIRRTKIDERVPHQYRAYMDVFSDEEYEDPRAPMRHPSSS